MGGIIIRDPALSILLSPLEEYKGEVKNSAGEDINRSPESIDHDGMSRFSSKASMTAGLTAQRPLNVTQAKKLHWRFPAPY